MSFAVCNTLISIKTKHLLKLGLRVMMFNATFNNISVTNISLYRGGQFYWWRKQEYPEKTTDLLYHIMLYRVEWAGFELTTLVVIGTDCIASCKSNYNTIIEGPVLVGFVLLDL